MAVLCNAGNSMPRQALHAVADLYLGDAVKASEPPKQAALSSADLDVFTGLYRNEVRGDTFRIVRDGSSLRLGDGTRLIAVTPRRLTDGDAISIDVAPSGSGHMDDGSGSEIPIQRVKAVQPTVAELTQYVGEYASEEAESTFTVRMDGEALALAGRPDRRYPLTPLYADAFDSEVGTIIFRRAAKRATEFSVVEDRVWDLRFRRVPADGAATRILVFGDSNTWGWIPVERGYPTTRYFAGERWPGVAQAALGERYEVVEEALNGRTTDLADPAVPELSGAGFDGSAYLPAAVASHLPLALVVIMLGTNDLKTAFDRIARRGCPGDSKAHRSRPGAGWRSLERIPRAAGPRRRAASDERYRAVSGAGIFRRHRKIRAARRALRGRCARRRRRISRCGPRHAGGRR